MPPKKIPKNKDSAPVTESEPIESDTESETKTDTESENESELDTDAEEQESENELDAVEDAEELEEVAEDAAEEIAEESEDDELSTKHKKKAVAEDSDEEQEQEDEKCVYNEGDLSDNDDDDDIAFDDDAKQDKVEIITDDKRITKPILFHYERTRLIGERTQQLVLGAKPMLKNINNMTAKEIAIMEINENSIPIIIERPLPNGKKERWHIHELAK